MGRGQGGGTSPRQGLKGGLRCDSIATPDLALAKSSKDKRASLQPDVSIPVDCHILKVRQRSLLAKQLSKLTPVDRVCSLQICFCCLGNQEAYEATAAELPQHLPGCRGNRVASCKCGQRNGAVEA